MISYQGIGLLKGNIGNVMKEIIVKNCANISPEIHEQNGSRFSVKNIIPLDLSNRCRADFVEVDPGSCAYEYHYHEENEEVFFIISGEATVKTENGEVHLKKGDIICFPANKEGSHIISNPSKTETLVYLDVGSCNVPDVVHLAETNKGMVFAKSGVYNFEKNG